MWKLCEIMVAKCKIEKFNGSKYSIWKLTIKEILRNDNCQDAIEGKPTNVINERWTKMGENVVINLHIAMANLVLSSVAKKKTAKEIWDTFHKLYEVESLQTRIFLKRKLYTLRMSESTLVIYHINNLNTLLVKFFALDFNTEENEHA